MSRNSFYFLYFLLWLSSIISLISDKNQIRYGEEYNLQKNHYVISSIFSMNKGTNPSTNPPISYRCDNAAASTSETSVHFDKTTWRRYIPEDNRLHTFCGKNLKWHKIVVWMRHDLCWSLTPDLYVAKWKGLFWSDRLNGAPGKVSVSEKYVVMYAIIRIQT